MKRILIIIISTMLLIANLRMIGASSLFNPDSFFICYADNSLGSSQSVLENLSTAMYSPLRCAETQPAQKSEQVVREKTTQEEVIDNANEPVGTAAVAMHTHDASCYMQKRIGAFGVKKIKLCKFEDPVVLKVPAKKERLKNISDIAQKLDRLEAKLAQFENNQLKTPNTRQMMQEMKEHITKAVKMSLAEQEKRHLISASADSKKLDTIAQPLTQKLCSIEDRLNQVCDENKQMQLRSVHVEDLEKLRNQFTNLLEEKLHNFAKNKKEIVAANTVMKERSKIELADIDRDQRIERIREKIQGETSPRGYSERIVREPMYVVPANMPNYNISLPNMYPPVFNPMQYTAPMSPPVGYASYMPNYSVQNQLPVIQQISEENNLVSDYPVPVKRKLPKKQRLDELSQALDSISFLGNEGMQRLLTILDIEITIAENLINGNASQVDFLVRKRNNLLTHSNDDLVKSYDIILELATAKSKATPDYYEHLIKRSRFGTNKRKNFLINTMNNLEHYYKLIYDMQQLVKS